MSFWLIGWEGDIQLHLDRSYHVGGSTQNKREGHIFKVLKVKYKNILSMENMIAELDDVIRVCIQRQMMGCFWEKARHDLDGQGGLVI